jgi:regulator of RNase E activity RraA
MIVHPEELVIADSRVVVVVGRADLDASATGAPNVADGVNDLEDEAAPVFSGASVVIAPRV